MPTINDTLEKIALEFANKVDLATSELVTYLNELVKGKKSAEAMEILGGINLEKAYELKMSKGFSAYELGAMEVLKSTFTTATVSEGAIRFLLNSTKDGITSEVTDRLGALTIQGVMDGIANGKEVSQVVKEVKGQMQNPELIVNTAYNQFSNGLTTMLVDELPVDTKWIYIGAYDGSTRPRCVDKIKFSGAEGRTAEEIRGEFGDMRNEIFRCRHKWTQRSSSPEDQGYNIKKQKDINEVS